MKELLWHEKNHFSSSPTAMDDVFMSLGRLLQWILRTYYRFQPTNFHSSLKSCCKLPKFFLKWKKKVFAFFFFCRGTYELIFRSIKYFQNLKKQSFLQMCGFCQLIQNYRKRVLYICLRQYQITKYLLFWSDYE